eukprot:XP_022269597.1 very-long-chain (3R)-3-hydroxyacyl-CoA dehydratase 2 [Canis lupus familiaris]
MGKLSWNTWLNPIRLLLLRGPALAGGLAARHLVPVPVPVPVQVTRRQVSAHAARGRRTDAALEPSRTLGRGPHVPRRATPPAGRLPLRTAPPTFKSPVSGNNIDHVSIHCLVRRAPRWLVIAVGLVRAYLAKGSYHSLYYSIEKPLKFFQTGALLEILHCAVGIVPSSVVLTSFQVMSRVFLIWAVTHSVKEVQSEDSVLLFVIAWTITEIIRYSFYTFSLLNHLPYLIKWARYTLFIVLYPMGVSGELLTIYAALPFVRQAGLYSISLPNKYNFSFDYYAFLILIMISYIPIFPQLYFHMIHQRRKVLSHTEEHKKFE